MGERVYAISVLLFAFLALCVLPPKITALMTKIQISAAEDATAISQLSQYLYDHGISRQLATRLQRSALHAVVARRQQAPESSISLLKLVSENLRTELHYELFGQLLLHHPWFRHMEACYPMALKQICHKAISKLAFTQDDI